MNDPGPRACLASVLPPERMSRQDEDLSPSRVSNPVLDPGIPPSLAVRPGDVDELQRLVRAANEARLNLTVSSSRGPGSRGGTVASTENIRVDLSSWKEIPWVNRRNRVCLIQPGVTYGELAGTLDRHGMTLSMPLAPRAGKSVLAAVMDREPSTWPNRQWDMSDPVASTEFVFGGGERFRTGAAGGPGTLEEQRASGGAQKSPLGPSQADFHRVVQGAQGTMGILTWITLRTEIKPTIQKPRLLGADRVEKLLPFVYEVQRPWLGEHSFLLDSTALAMLMSAAGSGSFDAVRASVPPFVCLQNVAGFERLPEARVDYQEKDIGDIARRHGLGTAASLGPVTARDLLDRATRPCGASDWRHALRGHCLSIFFLTTLDRVPLHREAMTEVARKHGIDEKLLGTYIQPVVQNHACHVEFLIPFDPADRREVGLARDIEREAAIRLAETKAFFSRPYGSQAGIVFQQNPLNTDLLGKVKGIFDPNRVLNRGKWGL